MNKYKKYTKYVELALLNKINVNDLLTVNEFEKININTCCIKNHYKMINTSINHTNIKIENVSLPICKNCYMELI